MASEYYFIVTEISSVLGDRDGVLANLKSNAAMRIATRLELLSIFGAHRLVSLSWIRDLWGNVDVMLDGPPLVTQSCSKILNERVGVGYP